MSSKEFFNSLLEQYRNNLPFVAYCKPNAYDVIALLQKDDVLHKIDDFTENGFVFAPFDVRKDAILIPFSTSKSLRLDSELLTHDEFNAIDLKVENNKEQHLKLVQNALNAISNSQFQKVVVSRKESIALKDFDLIETFIRLLNRHNLALVYCWYHPKVGLWMGATPETLVSTNGNSITTMALAGTQSYEGVLDVNWNEKEKKEQQFVTNYLVDNISAFVKNIEISNTRTVRAGNVLHLRTDIIAVKNSATFNLKQLIYTLHPSSAICGMPKIEAMQFILDNEHYNREFYSGFLGELNYESTFEDVRNSELFVNLRCMQIQNDQALVYVGGGITKDSVPENEWLETENKAKTIKSVIAF